MKRNAILIVGGGSGIGLSTAEYLSNKGYAVVNADKTMKDQQINDHVHHLYIDVLNETSVRNAIQSTVSIFENIDGLIYTVGVSAKKKSVEDFDKKNWEKIFNVNVTGLLFCLKYAFPFLKKCHARIVVVGSVAIRMGTRLSGFEYTISKTALSGLVKQFAIDWASDDILINAVHPSMTATPMLTNSVDPLTIEEIEKKIPLGRIAEPVEIARLIEFLVSKDNTYITGGGFDINGGLFLNA